MTGILNGVAQVPVRVSNVGSCTANATASQLAISARIVAHEPGVTLAIGEVHVSGGDVNLEFEDCGPLFVLADRVFDLLRSTFIRPYFTKFLADRISGQSLTTFACE